MSFVAQIDAAVTAARSFAQIDATSRAIWSAHAAGLIDDNAAQSAAEALQARKRLIGAGTAKNAPTGFSGPPRRHVPRSPDREVSIRRRRSCAASGAVPSKIAADFTTAEIAVLSVVAAEVRRAGTCCWPLDRVAALAGVSRRSTQYAIRRAAMLGLIQIEERPRPGAKHLPSRITIISRDWRAWLRIGRDRVQSSAHHGNPVHYPASKSGCSLTHSRSVPNLVGAATDTGRKWTPRRSRSPSEKPPNT